MEQDAHFMRKIISIAATVALASGLAGCSKPAPVAEASSEAAASGSAAVATPSHAPGDYVVTTADGKPGGTTTINADGSYVDVDAKGHRVAGLVKFADGKTCFDPSGAAPPECYTETAPAADGSFKATDAKGNTVTVKPAAAKM